MNLDSGDTVNTMGDAGVGAGIRILVGVGMVLGVGVVTVMEEVSLIMVTIGNILRKCRISRQETACEIFEKESEIELNRDFLRNEGNSRT
jgi:hypothetical protein